MNHVKVAELQKEIELECLKATLENVRQVRRKLKSYTTKKDNVQIDLLKDCDIHTIDAKAHLGLQKTISEAAKFLVREKVEEDDLIIDNLPDINVP